MKKKLLAIAALSAIAGVAQADVELYGVLDVAVGGVAHQASGDSQFPATVNPVSVVASTTTTSFQGMMNGGIQDSRWGIKGSENIGNGLNAIFTLESGIDLPSGAINNGIGAMNDVSNNSANTSLNGQLFNRQAWVGLQDAKLGTIKFGRNYAQGYDLYTQYDPVQFAQLFSPLGFSGGFGGGMGISENLRQDNSVKYSNNFNGVNYGVMYKFGNVAGNNTAGQGFGFNADYTVGNLSVAAVYQVYKDALKTAAGSSGSAVALTAYNTKGWILAAKYKLNDKAKIEAGYQSYALQAASDSVGISGNVSLVVTSAYGYTASSATSYTGTDQNVHTIFFGGDYDVSNNLNVAAGYYHIALDGYSYSTIAAGTPIAVGSGDLTFYSLLADYKLSKRTDVYAGFMYANYDGAQAYNRLTPATYNSPNNIYAVGIRHKF